MYHCTYQVHASRMRQRRNATQYCTHQPPEYAPMQVAACTHAVQVCKWACSMVGWRSVACTPRPSKEMQPSFSFSFSFSVLLSCRQHSSKQVFYGNSSSRSAVPVPTPPACACFLLFRLVLCCLCSVLVLPCVASLRCFFALLLCVASPWPCFG